MTATEEVKESGKLVVAGIHMHNNFFEPDLVNSPKVDIKQYLNDNLDMSELDDKEKDSLVEYYLSVGFLAKRQLDFEFNNKDKYHAALVMSNIFKNSTESIKIFTGNFKGDICDKRIYLDSLCEAINRNVKVDVIFQNKPNRNSSTYKLLRTFVSEGKSVELNKLTSTYREGAEKMQFPLHHFTVGDGKMVRYEFDGDDFKAYCNFDDPARSKTLLKNFETLKENSETAI